MSNSILRLPDVIKRTGLSRSSLYLYIEKGAFPAQVHLGPRAVGWPEHEVTTVNAARIAGKTEEEIRALVVKLKAARKEDLEVLRT